MTAEKIRRIHTVYGWVTAALCVLAGVSLILACLSVYAGGEGVFSRESVWAAFLSILLPVLLCLLSLLGGILLSFLLPLPRTKEASDARLFLDRGKAVRYRLFARIDLEKAGEELRSAVRREGKLRTLLSAGGTLFAAICAVPPLVCFLNPANFPNENPNAEVISSLYVLIPCLTLALSFLYAVSHLVSLSYDREYALLRSAAKAGAVRGEGGEGEAERKGFAAWFARHEKTVILALRGGVFALAVALIILGVDNGGMNDVLEKAVRICTECIGLG